MGYSFSFFADTNEINENEEFLSFFAGTNEINENEETSTDDVPDHYQPMVNKPECIKTSYKAIAVYEFPERIETLLSVCGSIITNYCCKPEQRILICMAPFIIQSLKTNSKLKWNMFSLGLAEYIDHLKPKFGGSCNLHYPPTLVHFTLSSSEYLENAMKSNNFICILPVLQQHFQSEYIVNRVKSMHKDMDWRNNNNEIQEILEQHLFHETVEFTKDFECKISECMKYYQEDNFYAFMIHEIMAPRGDIDSFAIWCSFKILKQINDSNGLLDILQCLQNNTLCSSWNICQKKINLLIETLPIFFQCELIEYSQWIVIEAKENTEFVYYCGSDIIDTSDLIIVAIKDHDMIMFQTAIQK